MAFVEFCRWLSLAVPPAEGDERSSPEIQRNSGACLYH